MSVEKISTQDRLEDSEMAARAAWLHFIGGLTQSEVAKRLGVPNTRAHRYIARAQKLGLVRISVDVESASCILLEERLREEFGLRFCRVAMDVPEPSELPLRALGALGSEWLMNVIASGEHKLIGFSHGRTIAAMVDAMGRMEAGDVRFVSMLGGLTRSLAANPYDVIHQLARKTGAPAYLMPTPLFADSAEDKKVMLSQALLRDVMELISKASLAIVGIGDMGEGAGTIASVRGDDATLAQLRRDGAHAEILGQFLDAEGQIMETRFDDQVMALPLAELRGRDVVAIVGGLRKKTAVRAALKSRLLTGLILDEVTARTLVEELDGETAGAGT